MAKKKPAVRIATTKATCELFASFDMPCPLCQVVIPANTWHVCQKDQE